MKEIGRPTNNRGLTVSTYAFTSTGASGTVNASGGVNVSALERGQSIIIGIDGGDANGFTHQGEYFVIPSTSGVIQLATSKINAFNSVPDYTASGDAGAGTIYPTYNVGGLLFIGTAGNVNMRGFGVSKTGINAFSVHKNIANGTYFEAMVGDVQASGTTATDMIIWSK